MKGYIKLNSSLFFCIGIVKEGLVNSFVLYRQIVVCRANFAQDGVHKVILAEEGAAMQERGIFKI